MKLAIYILLVFLLSGLSNAAQHNNLGEITILGSSNIQPIILTKSIEYSDIYQLNDFCKSDSTYTYIIKLNPHDFYCKNQHIKKNFLKLINSELHPFIKLKVIIHYNSLINNKANTPLHLEVTISDVTNNYELFCTKNDGNNQTHIKGTQLIDIYDFNLKPVSKFFGFVTFNNFVDIKFSFRVLTSQFSQK